ncbi:MAG: hypothetical protein KDJ45_05650 [Hyphomicrobiaceae bacterium]|nr:hypothetical protein [Hyphomicrobiaceae bacterium]MCC0009581.1 hypothetical protein [Hyphomicrobiaceae bacterium]
MVLKVLEGADTTGLTTSLPASEGGKTKYSIVWNELTRLSVKSKEAPTVRILPYASFPNTSGRIL